MVTREVTTRVTRFNPEVQAGRGRYAMNGQEHEIAFDGRIDQPIKDLLDPQSPAVIFDLADCTQFFTSPEMAAAKARVDADPSDWTAVPVKVPTERGTVTHDWAMFKNPDGYGLTPYGREVSSNQDQYAIHVRGNEATISVTPAYCRSGRGGLSSNEMVTQQVRGYYDATRGTITCFEESITQALELGNG